MAYIGKQPTVGNFQVCDAITVVNGQAAYTMQVSSANVEPENANHMLVSLNGILQKPGSSFTISGSTITFASNLATGDVIDFIILLGNVLDIGTPSDGTVTNAKLAQDIISGETALTSEPADTDEFLVSDAGTLKRIDYSLIKGSSDFKTLLSAGSGTAVSEIIFDNLDVSTYSHFMLVWFSAPEDDDVNLYAQIRTGGASGSTYSSSYYDSTTFGVTGDNSYYGKLEGNADHWRISNNAGNAGDQEFHCSQIFFTPRKSTYQNYFGNFIRCQNIRYDSGTNFRGEFSCGAFNHSDKPIATGLRIYYSGGDIEDYDYKLYGIV